MLRGGVVVTLALIGACRFDRPDDVLPPPDAPQPVDAAGTRDLVTDQQAADIVVGQSDFVSGAERPPFSAKSVLYPSLAAAAGRLWAGDVSPASRALGFMPLPSVVDAQADRVVGRPSITDSAPIASVTASNFDGAVGIADTGQSLLVVDQLRNRVLIWTPVPAADGAPATLVLGQSDFAATAAGNRADQLRGPTKVWSDGVLLVVSDAGNHRVLIWTSFPTRNAQPADLVLGQSGFGAIVTPNSAAANVLRSPGAIASDGHTLLVADGFNRILGWTALPSSNGQPADFVIGQSDLSSSVVMPANARWFNQVGGLVLDDGALFVADQSNQRVLIFDPAPATTVDDVSSAVHVLGQANPGALDLSQPLSARSLSSPRGLAITGDYLFVAEWGSHRVTRFHLDRTRR